MEGLMIFPMLLLQIALPEQFAMANAMPAKTVINPNAIDPRITYIDLQFYILSNKAHVYLTGDQVGGGQPSMPTWFTIGSTKTIGFDITKNGKVHYKKGKVSKTYNGKITFNYGGKTSQLEIKKTGKTVELIMPEPTENGTVATASNSNHWNIKFNFKYSGADRRSYATGFSNGNSRTYGNIQDGFSSPLGYGYSEGEYINYYGAIRMYTNDTGGYLD